MPKFAACLALSATLFHAGHAMDFPVSRRGQERLTTHAMEISSNGLTEEPTSLLQLPGQLPGPVQPVLAVKHVSKTGGTFLITLLNEMTRNYPKDGTRINFPRYYQEYPKPSDYPTHHFFQEKPGVFLISSVRNPCDWYVSQWSFAGQFDAPSLKQKYGRDFFGNETNFASWVQWATGLGGADSAARKTSGPHFGVLSLRLWEGLVKAHSEFPETAGVEGYDTTRVNEYTEHYDGRPDIEAELSAFDPTTAADCWVRDESYMEDLRFCLREYEARSGSTMDWAPFEREAKKSSNRTTFRNKSEHEKCDVYYTPELSAAVHAADSHLFRAFGYSKCCGASDMAQPPLSPRRK